MNQSSSRCTPPIIKECTTPINTASGIRYPLSAMWGGCYRYHFTPALPKAQCDSAKRRFISSSDHAQSCSLPLKFCEYFFNSVEVPVACLNRVLLKLWRRKYVWYKRILIKLGCLTYQKPLSNEGARRSGRLTVNFEGLGFFNVHLNSS